jgi:uncharacterized membrane protein
VGVEIRPWMPAQRRVALAVVLGVVAGAVVALVGPWQLAVLVGFDGWAIAQVVWLVLRVLPLDHAHTQAHSLTEDDSRTSASLAIITAALVCLVGVVLTLIKARQVAGGQEVVLTVVAVTSVVLAWLTVHLVFILRYADLYYNDGVGGIDFPGDQPPDYRDFAYLGFTVGMTYQVSDTNITSRVIRRTVIRHALISFLFGTVIIGVTINVMAGFIR